VSFRLTALSWPPTPDQASAIQKEIKNSCKRVERLFLLVVKSIENKPHVLPVIEDEIVLIDHLYLLLEKSDQKKIKKVINSIHGLHQVTGSLIQRIK
jgi:hypothetical protein